jgi:uncharacterized SAM-binding protein YcdF (DUF218 family)
MRCFARCLLNLLILAAIVAGVAYAIAPQIADWLSRSDSPREADAIIVLGSDPTRVFQAVELYRDGYATKVYLTVPRRLKRFVDLEREGVSVPWFEEAGRTILLNRGVPAESIDTIGNNLRSTYAEALATREHLGGNAKRLIVTTSPPHVNRARMIFSDNLPGIEVLVVGNRYEEFPRDWWTDPDIARYVLNELVQTFFYLVGGRFP